MAGLVLHDIITIVDAPNFEKGMKDASQVQAPDHDCRHSDINKSDIFDGNRAFLHDQIRNLNPFADDN
jgi:G3E family GTPase